MGSPEANLAEILSQLESKTTGTTERCETYSKFTRYFKEDEVSLFGLDVAKKISQVLAVIQNDMVAMVPAVSQMALQVLGVCLHDLDIVRSMSDDEGVTILKCLCTCIMAAEDKTMCTRALWCVGKQNLPDHVVLTQFKPILVLLDCIDHSIEKWGGQSVTVEHECVNTIARLLDQVPKEMSRESVRWGKILLQLVSHNAIKVRERVLSVTEGAVKVLANQKELVLVIMPTFKSKVFPELKKLFCSKNEMYVLKCWCTLVQIFGDELHHSTHINYVLPVVELGFKSLSPDVKIGAFSAWQQLIDNFATNPNILGDPKRIKLVMQVFKINNAKVEDVALAKLKVWWHFIWLLGAKISSNFDMVAGPLLKFCVGGTRLGEQGTNGTPKVLQNGASPATPRMNLTNNQSSHWPTFTSLQLLGCEVLAHFLGNSTDDTNIGHEFKLDCLRHDVVTGPSFFIKQASLLMSSATELFICLGKDIPESLVLHIWQWLIAHLKNAIDSPVKLDIRETLSTVLSQFQTIVLSRVLSTSLILKMFQGICRLPKKVLCSTAYNVKSGETVHGTPALFLTELLLTPYLLQTSTGQETYHDLFITIISSGTSNSTCTLGFLQSLLHILHTNAQFVDNAETLWRLWSSVANPILEHITKTNEVNQGDSLEHNFNCTVEALVFPVVHSLSSMPQPSVKTLVKTWTDLYKTVSRLAAMVTNAEANIICENVCAKMVVTKIAVDNMEASEVDLYVQLCHVIVTCLDFSSLGGQSSFSSSPKKWSKRRQKPLENIHSLVNLLSILQTQAISLAGDTEALKKSTISLQGMFNTLVDIFSTLFTHIASSTVISNLIGQLAQPIGSLFTEASKKTSAKVFNNPFQQKLETLWQNMCTCLQSRYTALFDSEFLIKLSPLLESTFLHSRRQIKTLTMGLWKSSFSNAATLEYPDTLKPVLSRVKEKSLITLPGWVAIETMVIEDTPTVSQMSQSQAPEPRIPGMPSPHKIHGSFLHKAVSPNVKKSPLRPPASPKPAVTSAKKKNLGFGSFDDKDFVVIQASPKKKMVLTAHQKEAMREKRVFPAMYNSLEISQDVSMMASHFTTDTQMEGTCSSTPTPTASQPFSLFGSVIPPTGETVTQAMCDSTTITTPDKDRKTPETTPIRRSKREHKPNKVKSPDNDDDNSQASRRKSVRFADKSAIKSSPIDKTDAEKKSEKISPSSKKSDKKKGVVKALKDTAALDDVVVISDTETITIDSQDESDIEVIIGTIKPPSLDNLGKELQSSATDASKETTQTSDDKEMSTLESLPQNPLGLRSFTQSTLSSSSKSSLEKSSSISSGSGDCVNNKINITVTPASDIDKTLENANNNAKDALKKADNNPKDASKKADNNAKDALKKTEKYQKSKLEEMDTQEGPSSEPLFSWTQKLNELNQSPREGRTNSPLRKSLSQDSALSPAKRRTNSPMKSPRRKRKPTNENEIIQMKGALDKWIIRSPAKNIDFTNKPQEDIIVANVSMLSGTIVEETQSPTKFKQKEKVQDGNNLGSIMETPPKNILESLPVGHGNSNRKLFNSQNGSAECQLDLMEDSNLIPASPNSKSFVLKTGTPVLKIKKLTNSEIKKYSPSKKQEVEPTQSPSKRAEKEQKLKEATKKTKMVFDLVGENIHNENSHEHDDFSEFTPLQNKKDRQAVVDGEEFFSKTLTDTEQAMLKYSDTDLISQNIAASQEKGKESGSKISNDKNIDTNSNHFEESMETSQNDFLSSGSQSLFSQEDPLVDLGQSDNVDSEYNPNESDTMKDSVDLVSQSLLAETQNESQTNKTMTESVEKHDNNSEENSFDVQIQNTLASDIDTQTPGKGRKRKQVTPKKMSPDESRRGKRKRKNERDSLDKANVESFDKNADNTLNKKEENVEEKNDRDSQESKRPRKGIDKAIVEGSNKNSDGKLSSKTGNVKKSDKDSQESKKLRKGTSTKVIDEQKQVSETGSTRKSKRKEDTSDKKKEKDEKLQVDENVSDSNINDVEKVSEQIKEVDESQECVVVESNKDQVIKKKGKKNLKLKKDSAKEADKEKGAVENKDEKNIGDDNMETEVVTKLGLDDKTEECEIVLSQERNQQNTEEIKKVNQKTPESRNSSKQPERRSTNKHKKEVAQKMIKEHSKDTVVNEGDSNLDSDKEDDITIIDRKNITTENLEKKIEKQISAEKDNLENTPKEPVKRKGRPKKSKSETDGQDTPSKVESKEKTEKVNESATPNEDINLIDSIKNNKTEKETKFMSDSDDDVPLIKMKANKGKKKNSKAADKDTKGDSSTIIKVEPVSSPPSSKVRTNKFMKTRLRSGEKKTRTSPIAKKSVQLAIKRTQNKEIKKKLSVNDYVNVKKEGKDETELMNIDMECADLDETIDEMMNENKTEANTGTDSTKTLQDFAANKTDKAVAVSDIFENEGKNTQMDKLNEMRNMKTKFVTLDETPKKGNEGDSPRRSHVSAFSDSKLIIGSRKFEKRKGIARRSILKPASVGCASDVGSPKRIDFRPITLGRVYSPTASPSASILKKRQLSVDPDSDTNSPPSKQRRVSFADPIAEAENLLLEAAKAESVRPPSPLVKESKVRSSADKQYTSSTQSQDVCSLTPSSSSLCDTEQTQNSYQSTQESQLNTTEPVWPQLVDCNQSVEKILPQLTSNMWSRGLGQLVRARNIHTIGDLSSLTETQLHNLPIKSPKIQTVKKALGRFGQNLQSKFKVIGQSSPQVTVETKTTEVKDKDKPAVDVIVVDQVKPVQTLPITTNKPVEPASITTNESETNQDKDVNSEDIDAILASSGDLLDEVNKLSQNISQSNTQDKSCDQSNNQSGSKDSESTEEVGFPAIKPSGSSFIDNLSDLIKSSAADDIKGLRTDQLFQAHQYLTEIQNKVVSSLRTRCHSPTS